MAKYDKFFSEMSKQEKQELRNKIKKEYEKAGENNVEKIREGLHEGDIKEMTKWMKLGIEPLDTFMVGPFTVKEMMQSLKMDMSYLNDRAALLKAVDVCMGVTKIELKKNDKGRYEVAYHDKAARDKEALEKKDKKYTLTRWDKFWSFFGIKTDHVRAVETSIASVKAYEEQRQKLSKVVIVKQLEPELDSMMVRTKAAGAHINERCNATKEKFAGWNNIFFDGPKPNDYPYNGTKVSALSLCMAIMHQRGKYDFSTMTPSEFSEIMNKDEGLKKEVKALGAEISKMVTNKETAIEVAKKFKYAKDMLVDVKDQTKEYDDKLKAMLKPEKTHSFKLSGTSEYIWLGKNEDNKKKEMFSNYCVSIKLMDDMEKIFGPKDPVYGQKNEFDKSVESRIKDTLTTAHVYNALNKKKYDTALRVSPIGKNDYNNLEEVVQKCEKIVNTIEMDFTRTPMRSLVKLTKMEVKQNKEAEMEMDEGGRSF